MPLPRPTRSRSDEFFEVKRFIERERFTLTPPLTPSPRIPNGRSVHPRKKAFLRILDRALKGRVNLEIIDNDLPGLTISPQYLEIVEGVSALFTVRLARPPSDDVTVNFSRTKCHNPDLSIDKTSLTFTASNWNRGPQAVRASVAQDDDAYNESALIFYTASGADYGDIAGSLSIRVIDDDDLTLPGGIQGAIVVSPATLELEEDSSSPIKVRLYGVAPTSNVTVALTKTNRDITLSPSSLTFEPKGWNEDQTLTVSVANDADGVDDTDTITLAATGGGYDGAMQSWRVAGIDNPGTIEIDPENVALTEGGSSVSFTVGIGVEPLDTQVVIVSLTSSNPGIEFTPSSLVFMASDWNEGRSVSTRAAADSNRQGGLDIIMLAAGGGNDSSARRTVSVVYVEEISGGGPSLSDPIRAQALAIPPSVAGDQSTLFIACKQDRPCTVMLDCAAQSDGSAFQGALPEPIPARGLRRLTARDIESYAGASWSGKVRLGCALRSEGEVASQVWTRSGDGVLVNNSGYIRSDPEGDGYRADIESITSPDGFEKSNIRIRCTASGGENCTSARFECYEVGGVRHDSASFDIAALRAGVIGKARSRLR